MKAWLLVSLLFTASILSTTPVSPGAGASHLRSRPPSYPARL